MSYQISRQEWGRIAASSDGRVQHDNAQQQRLFRLFQCLRANDLKRAQEMVDDGAPLDLPLIMDSSAEAGGPPHAEKFRLEEFDEIRDMTALAWAASGGDLAQVKWLLKNGASPFSVFAGGRDAAWVAMETQEVDLMDFFFAQGVMVNHRLADALSTTRLIAAVRAPNPSPQVVRALLEHKAQVNAYDKDGKTALHYNFGKENPTPEDAEIGRMLIDWGGNPAAVDRENTRVADLAHTDLQYSLLRQHGLEQSLPKAVGVEVVPASTEPEVSEDFDHRNIIRPAADDPGTPQLNKAPVFKKPRF